MNRQQLTVATLASIAALIGESHAAARAVVRERGAREVSPASVVATEEQLLLPLVPVPRNAHAGVVAIEGDWAFVGAPGRTNGGDAGVVYVFRRMMGSWSESQRITNPATGVLENFGASIAVLGTVAVIGAPAHHATGSPALTGAAYRYTLVDALWVADDPTTTLVRPAATPLRFGSSVAITTDWIAVGAPETTDSPTPGGVVVYGHDGRNGRAVTHADALPGVLFGASVAVSGDALLIGAPGVARAIPFDFDSSMTPPWVAGTALAQATGSRFGASVALAMDGQRALVGAPSDPAAPGSGAVYAYERTAAGAPWPSGAAILPELPVASDYFGTSVALSPSGTEAVIGAPRDEHTGDAMGLDTGSVYLFSLRTTWVELARFQIDARRGGQHLGTYVAVSGTTVLAGAPDSIPEQFGFAAAFPFPAPDGAVCFGGSRCESGFCVDGVCCDAACDGDCLACSVDEGAAVDGTCGADADDTATCTSICGAGTCSAGVCAMGAECDAGSGEDAAAPSVDSGPMDGGAPPPRYRISGCKCGVSSVQTVPVATALFALVVVAGVAVRRRRG